MKADTSVGDFSGTNLFPDEADDYKKPVATRPESDDSTTPDPAAGARHYLFRLSNMRSFFAITVNTKREEKRNAIMKSNSDQ
jgi:hypothetical protein